MAHYIIFIVCFVYYVIDNKMPVGTHGHEPSVKKIARLPCAFDVSQTRHTTVAAVSFLGGSRQTRHTRRQDCMP
jgi:hypothetical protein